MARSLGFRTVRLGATARIWRPMMKLAIRGWTPRSELCVLRKYQDIWMTPTTSCFSPAYWRRPACSIVEARVEFEVNFWHFGAAGHFGISTPARKKSRAPIFLHEMPNIVDESTAFIHRRLYPIIIYCNCIWSHYTLPRRVHIQPKYGYVWRS